MSPRSAFSAPRPLLALTGSAVLAASALLGAPAATAGSPGSGSGDSGSPTVVATGLNAPRLLSFGPRGALYVAEAGSGGTAPCAVGPTGEQCFGRTGAVTRIRHGSQRRVLTDLPSVAGAGGAEPLGPADVHVTGHGRYVLSMGVGLDAEARASLGPQARTLGTWVTGRLGSDRTRVVADLAAFEAAENPDGSTDHDSDPTGLARTRHGFVGTDSGGNTLVAARLRHRHDDGDRHAHRAGVRAVTVFPTIGGMQAVPTSVAVGPDGALYVSQLTGFPFPANGASIFRVVPGRAPTVYASGLTNVTDLAWSHGRLYAVQIAAEGLISPTGFPAPVGSLVRVHRGDNSTEDTVAGGLPSPYGVAIRHGAAYVSTCTLCGAGQGEVTRIPLG
jgi:hypothetical protein